MIYLVDIQNKYFDEPLMQNLELAYLASDLSLNGYEVRIIDGKGIHRNLSTVEVEIELSIAEPEIIVFYTKDITCNEVLDLVNRLKSKFDYYSILVGPRVALGDFGIMKNNKSIDLIVCGDSIPKLSKILNGDYAIPGIVYRKMGNIIENENQEDNFDLNLYEFPVREIGGRCLLTKIDVEDERYVVPVRSSRGCSYNCTFCMIPIQNRKNGHKWRSRSKENLMQEIKMIKEKYARIFIKFVDENFAENRERIFDIAAEISKLGDVEFSFTARVSTVLTFDYNDFVTLFNYGVRGIEVGIENFNDNVLQRYRKGHTCQEAIVALRHMREAGINPGIDFIMFDPWTTLDELKFNLKIIEQEQLDLIPNPMIYSRLYPFAGTPYQDIIDMDSYFENPEIALIYQKTKLFEMEMRQISSILSTKKRMLSSLVLLKAPSKFMGELVGNPQLSLNDSKTYNAVKQLV